MPFNLRLPHGLALGVTLLAVSASAQPAGVVRARQLLAEAAADRAEVGDVAGALRILREVKEPRRMPAAPEVARMARGLAEAGQHERALEAAAMASVALIKSYPPPARDVVRARPGRGAPWKCARRSGARPGS